MKCPVRPRKIYFDIMNYLSFTNDKGNHKNCVKSILKQPKIYKEIRNSISWNYTNFIQKCRRLKCQNDLAEKPGRERTTPCTPQTLQICSELPLSPLLIKDK